MKLQDIVAAVMAITLLWAIIAFTFAEIAVPEVLIGAFGIATGWVFSRSINGANGMLKARLRNGNRKDAPGP